MIRQMLGGDGPGGAGGGMARLVPLLENPRYEISPARRIEHAVAGSLVPGATVTVTASPVRGLEATVAVTERLAGAGYRVVPHLSARLLRDGAHLSELVDRLLACGVDDVFVSAGNADPPAGPFDSALPVLQRLTELERPFASTGIAGYPESHPRIGDDITVQAMWDKRRHATYIVSNLCFDPPALGRWITRVRARGVTLPIFVGLPGPVERARLLQMAARASAGDPARFLAGHKSWLLRLGMPGGFQPERFLFRAAGTLTSPAAGVAGLHLYTFNQVRETEAWRRAMLEQLGGQSRGTPDPARP